MTCSISVLPHYKRFKFYRVSLARRAKQKYRDRSGTFTEILSPYFVVEARLDARIPA